MMNNNLISTMVMNNNSAINDHNGKPTELAGICMLANGKYGAIIATRKAFSVNEVYVQDDKLHISTQSISGTVMPWHDLTTERGITQFNDTLTYASHRILKIVFIKVVEAETEVEVED